MPATTELQRRCTTAQAVLQSRRHDTEKQRLETLHWALFHVAQAAELPGWLPAVHMLLGEMIPARNLALALADGRELRWTYHVDERESVPPTPARSARSLAAWVVRHGQPLRVTPSSFTALAAEGEVDPSDDPPALWLGVPVVSEGLCGALVVSSYDDTVRAVRPATP